MTRTAVASVRGILGDHYDQKVLLTPFIETATALTDQVSSEDSNSDLSDALLELIERYLSAHFYWHADPIAQSKSTGKASGSFQGQTAMGFDASYYGQTAKRLDVTGYLAQLDMPTRPKAGASWLGLPPSEQTDYVDRD